MNVLIAKFGSFPMLLIPDTDESIFCSLLMLLIELSQWEMTQSTQKVQSRGKQNSKNKYS